jgi:hypothetical protein
MEDIQRRAAIVDDIEARSEFSRVRRRTCSTAVSAESTQRTARPPEPANALAHSSSRRASLRAANFGLGQPTSPQRLDGNA